MADPVNNIVKEIPFDLLVYKAAKAIADGQTALDFNSLQTAQNLATTMLPPKSVVLAIVETVDENGNLTAEPEVLTNEHPISLLAYGIEPTFYEFAETVIDLCFWVSYFVRQYKAESAADFTKNLSTSYKNSRTKYGGGGGLSLNLGIFSIGGGGGYSKTTAEGKYDVDLSVTSHTAYQSSAFGLNASASCRLKTTLKPKPPSGNLQPRIITQTVPV